MTDSGVENHTAASNDHDWPAKVATIPWWVGAVVVLGAALMAMGAVIALVHPAMLVSPGDEINSAAHIYAGYLVSRNLIVAVFLLLALGLRARGMCAKEKAANLHRRLIFEP